MRYHSFADVARQAELTDSSWVSRRLLPRSERLQRWADLLEECGGEFLFPLRGTEYMPGSRLPSLRVDGSALSVAFADPVLRGCGLAGDTYGDARRFFGLGHEALHRILCYCHYNSALSVPTTQVSSRIREAAMRMRRVEDVAAHLHIAGTPLETVIARMFV